jgi:hypothetical protein
MKLNETVLLFRLTGEAELQRRRISDGELLYGCSCPFSDDADMPCGTRCSLFDFYPESPDQLGVRTVLLGCSQQVRINIPVVEEDGVAEMEPPKFPPNSLGKNPIR